MGAALFVSLFLIAADPAAASSGPAAAPAAAQFDVAAKAAALARLVRPSDLVLEGALGSDKAAFDAGFRSDPQAAQMLTLFPGIDEAIWKDVEPEFRRIELEAEPKLRDKFADLYARRFTSAELDALQHFYTTPTGTKMIRQMITGLDAGAVWSDAAKSKDFEVSAEALNKAHDQAAKSIAKSLSPDDFKELMKLASHVPLSKLHDVGAELQALTVDYMNQDDPDLQKKVETIVAASAERYITAHPLAETK